MPLSNTKIVFIVLAFAVFLNGCASKNIVPDYALKKDSSNGIAAGSISFESLCDGVVYSVVVSNIETKNDYEFSSGPWYKQPDNQSGLGNGFPFAIELPSGQYHITSWRLQSGLAYLMSSSPITIPFTLQPGSAIYLGSFHFQETDHMFCAPKAANVSIENQFTRDISILKKKFSIFNNIEISVAIEPGNKIDSVGGSGNFQGPSLIFDLGL